MTRKYTTMAIDMMDEGIVSPQSIAEMCLAYMSEADVEDMLRCNDMLPEDEEDPEEDEDEIDCYEQERTSNYR